jgi:hypothetical protein
MAADRATLMFWRRRVAALQAPACGMAHEAIRFRSDAMPVGDPNSSTGYARTDICPLAVRSGHVGCTHTTARHALRDALCAIPGGGDDALLRVLVDLEAAIGRLDHRRYDAETIHARAVDGGTTAETTAAGRVIDDLVAEHRAYAARALSLRDAVLARLDTALVASDAAVDA